MPPPVDDDWSDSDDEVLSEVETSVLLGVPDGCVDVDTDVLDAAVSRIGGFPAFLPSREPSFSSSQCKICSSPMELLVQIWCPFEDSPMDRALYMWGCPRIGCQGKDGSVRAWRGLRYNEKYAVKLKQKLARKREKEKAKADALAADAEKKKNAMKSNPFSMSAASTPNPFGLGAHVFGESSPALTPASVNVPQAEHDDDDEGDDSDAESDSGSSEKSLLIAMASTTIAESPWKAAPSYPPLYLSTASEYLPPQPKAKLPPGVQVIDPSDDDGKSGKDISWAVEPYENSLDMDYVFERFTKRVGYEGEQCVRYELNGTPLPFQSDKVFDTLFPAPATAPLPVTKPDFKVVHAQKRTFDSSAVPPCPVCKSKRVFECQLMPNLINVLRSKDADKAIRLTDEERRKAVERALKGNNANEKRGMEWGTCMVFSCEKDCCLNDAGGGAKDSWREEFVYIQWDV
ncbi:programmed cell death protein 2 [Crucibulum laeve]|uniref:Programmed cell death protein 2 n=1 Tax=Crucibulum laeve TaxID=68775 RepID=A0A5C3M697_9AGAR|nr:programmed cell death protein 2 [Crucibulum laeve]